jgi:hypothetical protein
LFGKPCRSGGAFCFLQILQLLVCATQNSIRNGLSVKVGLVSVIHYRQPKLQIIKKSLKPILYVNSITMAAIAACKKESIQVIKLAPEGLKYVQMKLKHF